MNASELAHVMLEWEAAQKIADELANVIKEYVLEAGKTQTVGNVRATYSAGRKSHDYEGAWLMYSGGRTPPDDYAKVTWDWRKACVDAGLKEVPFSQSEPTVSLKII